MNLSSNSVGAVVGFMSGGALLGFIIGGLFVLQRPEHTCTFLDHVFYSRPPYPGSTPAILADCMQYWGWEHWLIVVVCVAAGFLVEKSLTSD